MQISAPAQYADFAPVEGLVQLCRPFRDRYGVGLEFRSS